MGENVKHDFTIHLMAQLENEGLFPYIIAKAATGSVYIGFNDLPEIGMLRIGNHPERSAYGYRWHLRSDMAKPMVLNNKGHKQYFYPVDQADRLVKHMGNYRRSIERRKSQQA